jgi:ADP-ribose pyrophosphatase YjhB (NUDIX family)
MLTSCSISNKHILKGDFTMAIFTWHDGEVPEGMVTKQVYGLIFTQDGRLLLRTEEKSEKTKYSLAGGRPESFDDGIEGTVRRELVEEVNVTIHKPIIVGYQRVDEEDGTPPFAQVRMTALIDKIGEVRPDPDTGRTYGRFLTTPLKAAKLLNWSEVGDSQINTAMRIASEALGIKSFADADEYI